MFAIYRNGSVGFRSTADNLYELKNTEAASRADLKPDDDTLFQEYMDPKDKKKNQTPNDAINAYKKVANIDTSERVYHVKDIMTQECYTLHKSATVQLAYDTLKEHKIAQIPVIDSDKKIIGLINKKFILNLIIEDIDNIKNILNRTLEDLYLDEFITTDPITDIRRVSKVMLDFRLSAIPVVDDSDILVGIVSKTDIIKAVSHMPHLQLWS